MRWRNALQVRTGSSHWKFARKSQSLDRSWLTHLNSKLREERRAFSGKQQGRSGRLFQMQMSFSRKAPAKKKAPQGTAASQLPPLRRRAAGTRRTWFAPSIPRSQSCTFGGIIIVSNSSSALCSRRAPHVALLMPPDGPASARPMAPARHDIAPRSLARCGRASTERMPATMAQQMALQQRMSLTEREHG